MSDIVQRLRDKELLSIEEDGYTHFLPKNPDGDDGAAEIERLRAENEKLREEERERCAKICEENNDDAVMQSYGTYYATRIRKS